jgi:hypothetical protein
MRLGTHFHLVLRLRVSEALPLFSHMALWQAQGHLYFYITMHVVSTYWLCTSLFCLVVDIR